MLLSLAGLAGLALLLLLAAAAAARLIERAGPQALPVGERLFLSAALGLGLLSCLMTALGALQALTPAGFGAAVLLLGGLGASRVPCLLCDLRAGARAAGRHAAASRIAMALALLLVLHGLCLLVAAAAPVYGYDALDRHLTVAKAYLESGGFRALTHIWGADFPSQGVMLYALSLALGDDRLAQVTNVFAVGAGALGTFVLARPLGSSALRLGAALAVVSLPTTSQYMASPYVDVYVMLWILAAWVLLTRCRAVPRPGTLALAGVVAGLAASVKLQGCIVLAILCVVAVFWLRRDGEAPWRALGRATLFGLCAAVPVAFWLGKSAWLTGNPVYPLYYETLGGIDWSVASQRAQEAYFGTYTTPYTPASFLRSMWQYLFFTTIYMGNTLGPGLLYGLFVARSPSLRRDLGWIAIFGGVQFLGFFHLTTQVRYIYHALPFLATAAMGGVGYVWRMQRPFRWLAGSTLAVLYAIHFAYAAALVGYVSPVLLGVQDRHTFLEKRTQYYEAFRYVNRELPDEVGVLIPRSFGYYLDRPFVPWLQKDQGLLVHAELSTPARLRQRLSELGLTYVVEDKTKPYDGVLRQLLATGATRLFDGRRSAVFHLVPVDAEGGDRGAD